eukprot:8177413-Alexandrium_andersonii.AAC.1
MSARLVGSEMCIRDRGRTAKPPPATGAGGESAPPCPTPAGPPAPSSPVSYTHLTLPTICSV